MPSGIPQAALTRLSSLYRFLEDLDKEGVTIVSSNKISVITGIPAETLRKDISLFGLSGTAGGRGYSVKNLKERISEELNLGKTRKVCIVGLGRLGASLLSYPGYGDSGFFLAAGFDKNINRMDMIKTDVPLYPMLRMPEIVKEKEITLAVLAVPGKACQVTAELLIDAGIRGIVNCTPALLNPGKSGVFIRNLSVLGELSVLSILLSR